MAPIDHLSAESVLAHAADGAPPSDFPMRWLCIETNAYRNVYELTWYDDCWEDTPGAIFVSYPDAPHHSGYWLRKVSILSYEPGDNANTIETLHGEHPWACVDELADDITADAFDTRDPMFRRAGVMLTADTITDEQIRALRDESRAVGDNERARCCNAALGVPTSDGALGTLDQRVCRERIAKIFHSDGYHVRNNPSPFQCLVAHSLTGRHVTAPLDRQCINCGARLEARDGLWCAKAVRP